MYTKESTIYGLTALLMASMVLLSVLDIHLDILAHYSPLHLWIEFGIVVIGVAITFFMLVHWHRARLRAHSAESHLQEYLQGVGRRIEGTLASWQLTRAERKVAALLLKGKSHREIAAICSRTEGTVRQHAVSVYHKAGVNGRAEFVAYFLQDVIMPELIEASSGPNGAEDEESDEVVGPSNERA